PRERPDGKVEAGRAELALVASPGNEVLDERIGTAVAQDVPGRAVDMGVAAPAALVAERPPVAGARDDEPRVQTVERVEVSRQPRERSERPRAEEEPVRSPER